jgi:hypothetical protein
MAQITELRAVPPPVVYGFLRLRGRAGGRRASALAGVVQDYCDRHELELGTVVTENDSADHDAFAGLVDELKRVRAYGVVVPSDSHLGGSSIARARRDLIACARLRLIVVRGAARTPSRPAGGSS